MANPTHLNWLREGAEAWNARWRSSINGRRRYWHRPMVGGADLSGLDLHDPLNAGINLEGVDLVGADLRGTNFHHKSLRGADCRGADFHNAQLFNANLHNICLAGANLGGVVLGSANLTDADLTEARAYEVDLSHGFLDRSILQQADFRGARLGGARLTDANLNATDLSGADLTRATLERADLRGANLQRARLVETNLSQADLSGCMVYGASAWNIRTDGAIQAELVVTPLHGLPDVAEEPKVTVDNIEVAQFIYLMLANPKLRDVLDTIARKAVLILGRFTPERKSILESIREALRLRGYVPILFDFDGPASRDLTETVSTLAHLARFVIADLSDARSLPQELSTIIPILPSVPVQPIVVESQRPYAMYEHWVRYPWVLPPVTYSDQSELLAWFDTKVIAPAEARAEEMNTGRNKER